MLKSIVIVAAFWSASAFATLKQECQNEYSNTVKACAQGLNALSTNIRAGAQKSCVEEAKVRKDACLSGTEANSGPDPRTQCLASCQALYTTTESSCGSTYSTANCSGNASCELMMNNWKAVCISDAVNALNTCNQQCPL